MSAPTTRMRPLPARQDVGTFWRYTFCDLRSRLPLARLPLTDVDLSEVIGGPAEGSGFVSLLSEQVRRADPWTATQEKRTLCFAERVRAIAGTELPSSALWAGIVWKRVFSGTGVKLSMATPESWLAKRRPVARTFPDTTDDAAILRTIVTDLQAVDGGSIGLLTPAADVGTLSGLTVDPSTDDATALEVVQAVADAAPLEWRIAPGGNAADGFTLTLVTAGHLGGASAGHLVWTSNPGGRAGSEVLGYEVTADGTDVPNELHGAASTDQDIALRSVATSGELAAGYPLLQDVATGEVREPVTQARLDRATAAELTARRLLQTRLTSLTVRGDRGPDLATYGLGNTLSLQANDHLWPAPTTVTGRILGRRIQPAEQGRNETVAMTLGVA